MSKGKKGRKFKPNTKPKLLGIQYWGPPVFALLMGMGIELLDHVIIGDGTFESILLRKEM